MRVLMVSHRFPPDAVAGVERYTETLAAELAGRGDTVTVATRRPGPGAPRLVKETLEDGVELFRLTGGDVDRDRFLRGTDRLDRLFEEVLALARPEVVHLNHLIDLSPRFIELAHRAGAAVVLTLHDFYMACPRIILQKPGGELCAGPDGGRECATTCYGNAPGPDRRWALRALYHRRLLEAAERIVCPSAYVADFFTGWGAPAARTRAVSNGIWLEAGGSGQILHEAAPGGRLRLLALGAVLRHKGQHMVLEALAAAGLDAVDFTVAGPIGDPGYARELRETADALPGVKLRLYGSYQPRELPFLLQDVDCLVVPSQWPETFCLVVREALVRGVPVITTRLGALPDAVIEGKNGFLYDHDDPAALRDLLVRLSADVELLETLREGARGTHVMSLAEHATEIRGIYVEALDELGSGDFEPAGRRERRRELEELHVMLAKEGFGATVEAA